VIDGSLSLEMLVVVVAVASFLIILTLIGGVAVLVNDPRRRVRKRMDAMGLNRAGEAVAGGGGLRLGGSGGSEAQVRQRRIQEKLRELETAKERRNKRRNRLRRTLQQAGLSMDPTVFLLMNVVLTLAVAGVMIVMAMNPLVSLAGGLAVGFGLPRFILGFAATRRQNKFTSEFPNAIDVLVRGVQSGLPVSECLAIVSREVPDPVGGEFRMLLEGQKVGMPLADIMNRGLERMPTAEYKFFAIVLQIQQQTGGNLAETLANLSTVIRDRKQMRNKVKALASEAKASAWIIGSLPFAVAILVSIMSPDYLLPLFETRAGHYIIAGGLTWMAMGVGIMAKMINFKM
jgi:tight adherence protein B